MRTIPVARRLRRSSSARARSEFFLRLLVLSFVACLAWSLGPTSPAHAKAKQARFCSETAKAQLQACTSAIDADQLGGQAVCTNLSDPEEARECFGEVRSAAREGQRLCRDQHSARREVCAALGEGRYDPDFDPEDFEQVFANLNPYFPLQIGNHWEYVGGDETIAVDVLNQTKRIEGVTCIVVNDVVEQDGAVIEDTDDWYAQRSDGTVDYCGEISLELETFEGDAPEIPEIVDIGGSWKAGRDGDMPGTLFPGSPEVGVLYRQEWSPGNAEDLAQVLSTTYGYGGADPELDEFVPQELALHLCHGDCVVTREFTPIDPGAVERKYYAPGVGLFLEVDPESGDFVQLVACNVGPGCAGLPPP